jgi:hypothetical protein
MKREGRRRLWAILMVAAMAPVAMAAQATTGGDTPAPKESTQTGCVTELPNFDGVYVLATSDACLLLRGDYDAQKMANHVVTLKGVFTEPAGTPPRHLEVRSTEKIADACTQTCKPGPAKSRGLHGSEKPGSNEGTAGAAPTIPTSPQ